MRSTSVDGGLKSLCELHAPFLLHLADAEESDANHADDEGGKEREGALVVVLVGVPCITAYCVKGADDAARNDEADEEAYADSKPYLFCFIGQ
ncbi:hypothetical protein RRF57_004962 [Xylaria bambusicola]|uniref:Uncharacterized protein n=1 Tax=Xylaria bambusicola TaxID=326684 RepID=A0AAN7UIM0_9PEZI